MPECYTHALIATKALMRSGQTVASHPAFLAGANGPDPLFMYKPWTRNREPDLPALAQKMHTEKTGEFLQSILNTAITPVQQSYVLGFVTHYIADCTLWPYIEAVSKSNRLYEGEKGQRKLEASLDSTLYYKDYKTYSVPLHAGTPVLITDELAQVTSLLHEGIKKVYGQNIPAVALADMFHDNMAVRSRLVSKNPLNRFIISFMDGKAGKSPKRALASLVQPAKPLDKMPERWVNPYTNEEINLTLDEILAMVEQTSAVGIIATMRYWLGELDEDALAEILGNNSYYTGLPVVQMGDKEPLAEKE